MMVINEPILKLLLRSNLIHKSWTVEQKIFAINIYNNDISFLEENYKEFEDIYVVNFRYSGTKIHIYNAFIKIASAVSNLNTLIKLIELLKMNVNNPVYDAMGNIKDADVNLNCLLLCLEFNSHMDVIKYLIEEEHMDTNVTDIDGYDCVGICCLNPSMTCSTIKYLVENKNMSVNTVISGYNNIELFINGVCNGYPVEEEHVKIITYLIEKIEKKLMCAENIKSDVIEIIIPLIKCNEKLNFFLNTIDITMRKNILLSINPLLLNLENQKIISFNPNIINYNQFIKLIDEFDQMIPFLEQYKSFIPKPTFYCTEYNSLNPVFIHNSIIYYGNVKRFNESFLILRDIVMSEKYNTQEEQNKTNDLMILEGSQPTYLINLYIHTSHHKHFDINNIKPNDIEQFVKFIDQYPLDCLSVDLIEFQLIEYFNENSIEYNQYMKDICVKYQLRKMYISIHNKIY